MATESDVDRGWAWFVAIAASIVVLVGSGAAFSAGLFQPILLEQFRESVSYTSWVTALFSSFLQLGGPVSSLISNLFTCRVSVMVGGALVALGLVLSSFATNISYLIVTFGFIGGLGLGMTYTSAIVITSFYFRRKRNMMTGIVLASAGVGICVYPYMIRLLLEMMSWKEAVMVLAGIAAQLCVCGAIMYPLEEEVDRSYLPCKRKYPKLELQERESKDKSEKKYDNFLNVESKNCLSNSNGSLIFYSQVFLSTERIESIQNLNAAKDNDRKSNNILSFLTNKPFLVLCANYLLTNAAYGGMYIHFPDFVETQGGTLADAALAMSLGGPATSISRFLVGALGNDPRVDYLSLYVGLKLCTGLLLCVLTVVDYDITVGVGYVLCISFYVGCSEVLTTALCIDCVGLRDLASALGAVMVSSGLGYLIAPPIVGRIVDLTGSYSSTMFISGSLFGLSGLLCLLIPLVKSPSSSIGYHPPLQAEYTEVSIKPDKTEDTSTET